MIRDADRQDLWEKYREIYTNAANINRGADANAFFEANKEEMLRGAVVLWPEKRDYKMLMDLKFNNPLAFQTEQQNDPIDKTQQVFDPEKFTYYENFDGEFIYDHGQQIPLSECVQDVAGIDLARGRESGDYVAIGRVVKSRAGAMYILSCDAFKVKVSEQLERAIKFIETYKPRVFLVEAVAYQGSFADQLKEELQKRGIYHTKIEEVKQSGRGKKEARIMELEPMVSNGSLRFHPSHYLLLDQMEKFKPSGSTVNDDCPDVIQMCVAYMNNNANTAILDYYKQLAERNK